MSVCGQIAILCKKLTPGGSVCLWADCYFVQEINTRWLCPGIGYFSVLGPRLHQALASMLRSRLRHSSHWPQWSCYKIGCNPILKQLYCGQWKLCCKRYRSVDSVLALMLGVNVFLGGGIILGRKRKVSLISAATQYKHTTQKAMYPFWAMSLSLQFCL